MEASHPSLLQVPMSPRRAGVVIAAQSQRVLKRVWVVAVSMRQVVTTTLAAFASRPLKEPVSATEASHALPLHLVLPVHSVHKGGRALASLAAVLRVSAYSHVP